MWNVVTDAFIFYIDKIIKEERDYIKLLLLLYKIFTYITNYNI